MISLRLRQCAASLAIAILLLTPAAATAQGYVIQTIAVTGQPAPGTDMGGGVAALYMDLIGGNCCAPKAVIDASGNVGFAATLQQAGDITSSNDFGFWVGNPETVALSVQEGAAIPGSPGNLFGSYLEWAILNDDGGLVL